MQCRACLKVNCESVTLLDENKMKCFNLITDLNIHMEDSLPQQLCENCAKDLEFSVGFRKKCITSNSILVSARKWNEDSKMTIQIGQEDLKCHKFNDIEKDNKVDIKIKSECNDLEGNDIQETESHFETEIKTEYNDSDTNETLQCEYELVYECSGSPEQTSKVNTRKKKALKEDIITSNKKQPAPIKYDCGSPEQTSKLNTKKRKALKEDIITSNKKQSAPTKYDCGYRNKATKVERKRVDNCFVPLCPSNSAKFPNKIFLTGPSDPKLRKIWFKAVQRTDCFSSKTVIRCCEDHFDLENDVKNWMKYRFCGGKIFLKKDVVPHIFACQDRIMPSKSKLVTKKRKRAKMESVVKTPGLCAEMIERDKLCDHVKSHESNNHCGVCSSQLKDWETMLYHRISHLQKPNIICHICLKIFQLPISLEYHYNVKHFGKIEDAAKCRECNIDYNTLKSLKQHRKTVHNDTDKTYTCKQCSECFRNENVLRYHKNKYHNESNETKNKTWRCNECDYTCKSYCSFRKHRLRAHTPNMVCCKFCEALFKDESGLQRHKCKYSAPAVCPVCGVVIKVPIQMRRHLASHSDERKHKCDRCDVAYKSRGALRVHMNKHDGIRAHKCEYCPAAFWGHSALIKHRRLHTGEKPYVCKVCSKGFISNHNLKVHMKVHGIHNLIKKKDAGEDSIE
ncbi:zinc finger protein 845-like isoform X1 [Aricia agestis]|uniref:zinc finger protein 845-like isoform X1 n=1 Tax=Aricia agestis TaxID=91739 RepID=UPI001C2085AC|nr:zinc finger protein 845-like isoform X1 [Aricia agestis]